MRRSGVVTLRMAAPPWVDVDIFAPPRSDWLDGTDTYFHQARE